MTGGQDHSGDAVRQRLAEIQQRADNATAAPWKVWAMEVLADPVGNSKLDDGLHIADTADPHRGLRTFNADFIAAARQDVPRLVAALTAVLDKHEPEKRYQPDPDCGHSYDTPEDAARSEGTDISSVTYFEVCDHCGKIEMGDENDRDYRESLWPCPTYRAVATALEEQP